MSGSVASGAGSVATRSDATAAPELVVLLDGAGEEIGTMDKSLVHGADTPLHLAFSCYAFDPQGRLLLTRRALAKQTWPAVWTNTACGHPAPGEAPEAAVRRRLRSELGLEVAPEAVRIALPDFRYRAVDASGIVEHEICPVYVVALPVDAHPEPDPAEVMEWRWVDPAALARTAEAAPYLLSPWSVLQLRELSAAGLLPG